MHSAVFWDDVDVLRVSVSTAAAVFDVSKKTILLIKFCKYNHCIAQKMAILAYEQKLHIFFLNKST